MLSKSSAVTGISMKRLTSRCLMWLLLLAILAASACNQPRSSIRGIAQGPHPKNRRPMPIPEGRIRFFMNGEVQSADIREGLFELNGLPIGEALITIETPDQLSIPRKGTVPPNPTLLRFTKVDTTPLRWTLSPGSQEVTISLINGTVQAGFANP